MKKLNVFLAVLTAAVLCMAGMPATAAAQEIPEGYPAIVEGLDFGGATVYIYEWWSNGQREENPTDMMQLQYDYWDWLEATYNVHVVETSLSDWGGIAGALAEKVANRDSSELCIIAVAGDFAGSVVKNQLFMDWTVGLDDGSPATQELMTVNGVCYGTTRGAASEPRQSVFFNKDVLTEAGIDWHEIYAAQANGTWTWAKMEQYMSAVQRDTDEDGQTDIWGLTGNRDDITVGLMISNGADFYDFDESGKLVPAIESDAAREALAKSKAWGSYIAPVESWDGYKQNWAAGNVAFMIGQAYEGFNRGGCVNSVANWGYAALPMGPRMDHYVTTVENNVYGIPNVYDEAMSRKLQQLFRLWTWDAPGTEDAWQATISGITEDEDAIATYGMLRDPENGATTTLTLLDGNMAAGEILWGIDGSDTVDELIDSALPAFEDRCDEYNEAEAIEWTLEDGVLTVSGTGKMKTHPWSGNAGEIREAIITEGVTTICEGAFAYCGNLTTVRLPYSLEFINDGAFPDSCTSLADIWYNGLEVDWDGGVMPWGCEHNDAVYRAYMHYRTTAPAGEDYPVTVSEIRRASDGETLQAGDDGYYTVGNNETGLFSFSAPAMEGYDRSYRFCNISWWDTPAEPEPGAGVIGYDSKISVWDGENEATVTAMAVYVPADPDEPILLSSRDISFHITWQPSGITATIPDTAEPGAGYCLTVTIPETTNPAGADWYFEGYKYAGDEFCFMQTNYEYGDLSTGVNEIWIPEEWLLGPGRYMANFSFSGVGYERFSCGVDFAVVDAWLPEDLDTIGEEAFAGADFRAVWVPDGCTHICSGAFSNCGNLEFISIPAGAEVETGAWDNNVYVHRR